MMADPMVLLAVVSFAIGLLGYRLEPRYPRLGIFMMSMMFAGFGAWLLFSTLLSTEDGKVRLLARHAHVVSKDGSPVLYTVSVWGQAILGGLTLAGGLAGMVASWFMKRRGEHAGRQDH
jgi:Trk-type K+ transport system membrane component